MWTDVPVSMLKNILDRITLFSIFDVQTFKNNTMELSSNCFGLITEFSLWIETDNGSIPVTLKRPLVIKGEYKTPMDSVLTIEIDEDVEFNLTEDEKSEIKLFILDEITSGRVKFPVSLEFQTNDFNDVNSMELR